MEVTIEKLYTGKSTEIKGSTYLSTKEYCKPFIDEMSKFTKDFVINAQTPDQVTFTSNVKDLTFNRVWIQAIMPNKCDIDHYAEVYGLVYGLDVKTPVYKVYRAYMNRNDNSLAVFNPEWIKVYKIKPEEGFSYNLKALMEMTCDVQTKLQTMKSTFCDPVKKHELLGRQTELSMLIDYSHDGGKVKLAPANVIKVYQNVYMDSSSKYYVKSTEEGTVFNYYNAFSSLIMEDNKDILNKWEKTYLIKNLFNSVCKL